MKNIRLIKIRQLSIDDKKLNDKERYVFYLLNKSIDEYAHTFSISKKFSNFKDFYVDIFDDSFKIFYEVTAGVMAKYSIKYDNALELIRTTLEKERNLLN